MIEIKILKQKSQNEKLPLSVIEKLKDKSILVKLSDLIVSHKVVLNGTLK